MKFVRFDGARLGLLSANDEGVIDLTERLGLESSEPLVEYITGDFEVSDWIEEEPDRGIDEVRLEAPIRRPNKIVAAPGNYEDHIREAIDQEEISVAEFFSVGDYGYFLKAPSSVIGPEGTVEIPFPNRRVDHEIELAFIMEQEAKDVVAETAWESIFGYTILLDISVRGEQDRSNRKSYDTFTVIGPCVRTAESIPDPQDLELHLSLNGDVKQQANTSKMIYNCGEFLEYASTATTLEPGDVVTTGTPAGVSPISDGDTVEARIEAIGSMTVDVVSGNRQFV